MRVGVDLDGVCFNFEDSLRAFLRDKWGHPEHLMTDPQEWSFHDDWGLTLQQFKDACNAGVNAQYVFYRGEPYEGVPEAVQRIKAAGHEVNIITARFYGAPGMAQYLTARWLDKYHIPYDTLTFSRDKTVVPTDFMAEDNTSNFDALNVTECFPFLIDRPWNWDVTGGVNRRRVRNLTEFADFVIEEGKNFDR